jgi:hypothetical protein
MPVGLIVRFDEIEGKIRNLETTINAPISMTVGNDVSNDKKEKAKEELLKQADDLERLWKEVCKVTSAEPTPNKSTGNLRGKIEEILRRLSIESPLRDNQKQLFTEAGQWARHFSTVRMTVMTFTITTCVALIAWKWQTAFDNHHNADGVQQLALPVGVLWGTGVLTFWFFTFYTYGQIRRQQKKRHYLPARFGDRWQANRVQLDGASLVVPMLTGVFLYYFLKEVPCLGAVWKTVLWSFVVAGILFPFGLNLWNNKRWAAFKLLVLLLAIAMVCLVFCFSGHRFGCHYGCWH